VSDSELRAIVAFVHDRKLNADLHPGSRRSVANADLQTGDAEAGKKYFNGQGRCATCHSPTGDLAGIAARMQGLALFERMLYPRPARNGAPRRMPAQATVTLPSGQIVAGTLAHRDEFTIAIVDSSGSYRSWETRDVKFTVTDPLEAHANQLGKYTDD